MESVSDCLSQTGVMVCPYRICSLIIIDIVHRDPFNGFKDVFVLPNTPESNPLTILEYTI